MLHSSEMTLPVLWECHICDPYMLPDGRTARVKSCLPVRPLVTTAGWAQVRFCPQLVQLGSREVAGCREKSARVPSCCFALTFYSRSAPDSDPQKASGKTTSRAFNQQLQQRGLCTSSNALEGLSRRLQTKWGLCSCHISMFRAVEALL